MAIWGIVYALSAPLVGKVTTSGNALKLLRLSGWGTAACSLLFIFLPGVWGMLLLIGVMGVVSAFYCIPFQMCANSSNSGRTPERAAGFYTFSWSIGTAAGTFGIGCLPGAAGFAVNAAIGIVMVILARRVPADQEKLPEEAPGELIGSEPDRMVPVWIFGAAGAFCMAVAGALLPLRSVELKTGVFLSGAVLGVLRLAQGGGALLLIFLHKAVPWQLLLGCGGLCGITGLMAWAFGENTLWLFAGSLLFGLCGAFFYFSLVYHALRNVRKGAACLGVNEMILGITGIIGPGAGGAAAQAVGIPAVFGVCAGLLLFGTLAAGIFAALRNKNKVQENSSLSTK